MEHTAFLDLLDSGNSFVIEFDNEDEWYDCLTQYESFYSGRQTFPNFVSAPCDLFFQDKRYSGWNPHGETREFYERYFNHIPLCSWSLFGTNRKIDMTKELSHVFEELM